MQSIPNDRIKQCHQCGAMFTCSIENCWCAKLPAVVPMNPDEDCLCVDCLRKVIEGITKTESVAAAV